MTDTKISAATDTTPPLATDMLPFARSGDTTARKITVGNFLNNAPASTFANVQKFAAGINLGAATTAPISGIHSQGSDQTPLQFISDAASLDLVFIGHRDSTGGGPRFLFKKARGTIALPTATLKEDDLVRMNAAGYQSVTGAFTSNQIFLAIVADEPFTNVAAGRRIEFWNVMVGQTVGALALSISGANNLAVVNGLNVGAGVTGTDGGVGVGDIKLNGSFIHQGTTLGLYNHAAVTQPAAPVTLADVIAVIRGCGLSA